MSEGRIESRRHPAVAAVARLRREPAGAVVAEGPHLVAEGLAAGWCPVAAFATERWRHEAPGLTAALRRALRPAPPGLPAGWHWVGPRVMDALAGTASPQGLLAVFTEPPPREEPPPAWVLALDGVQDAGNVGALARCLLAFGGEGSLLLCGPGTAHPLGERALRASAGAAFRLRRRAEADLPGALAALGVPLVALCPRGGTPLAAAGLRPPLALVVGGEGPGLHAEVEALCRPVTIPLRPGAESLNVACAAAIALHAAARDEPSGAG
jgi:TrmH family RNA methyltransferase